MDASQSFQSQEPANICSLSWVADEQWQCHLQLQFTNFTLIMIQVYLKPSANQAGDHSPTSQGPVLAPGAECEKPQLKMIHPLPTAAEMER